MLHTTNVHTTSRWFPYPSPSLNTPLRMFCFPYAGGGASTYRTWGAHLKHLTEVYPVELPGRETRLKEKPMDRFMPLVHTLVEIMYPLLDKPFVLFGHSMGAILAFEICRTLRQQQGPLPECLVVSGAKPPQLRERSAPLHTMGDDAFISALRGFNGTPEAVLKNQELMKLMLPVLRADFTLDETYEYVEQPGLGCPIIAFAGDADKEAPETSMRAWSQLTSERFELQVIPGNHFYIHHTAEMLPIIESCLRYTFSDIRDSRTEDN